MINQILASIAAIIVAGFFVWLAIDGWIDMKKHEKRTHK